MPSMGPGTAWEMRGVNLNLTYGRTPMTVTKKKGPYLFSTFIVPPLPGWYTRRKGAITLANGLGLCHVFLDYSSHPVQFSMTGACCNLFSVEGHSVVFHL